MTTISKSSAGQRLTADIKRIILYLALILIAAIMAIPFLWMLSSSLKTQFDVIKIPPVWIPVPMHFENYITLFIEQPMLQFILNTVEIVVIVIVGQLFFSSLAAYAFARIDFKGRKTLFFFYVATLMVPGQVTMIPVFLIFSKMHMTDTYVPLILPAFFSAFGVFLLRQFFISLPKELEDSAEIDGCNPFRIYFNIMLPLIMPALCTLAVFTLMGTWNDYLNPLIYLSTPSKFTMTLGLAYFKGTYTAKWNLIMAGSVLSVIPIMAVYLFAQKYFVEGIAFTGVKG